MKKKRQFNLQQKITYTYLLVCIIPILIVGIYAYKQSSKLVQHTEKGKMNDFLLQITFSMENQLNIFENLADYIAFNETIYQVINYPYQNYYDSYAKYSSLVNPILDSMRYLHTDMSQIVIYTDHVTDAYGASVLPLDSVKEEYWYKNMGYSTEIQWFVKKDTSVFLVRNMLSKMYEDANSILLIEFKYEELFLPLQVLGEENIGVIVTDAQDRIIYDYDTLINDYKDFKITSSEGLRAGEIHQQTGNYYVSMESIEGFDWNIFLYKPIETFPKYSNNILFTVCIIIFVSLIIMYGVGVIASHLIVKPIERLTENMRQFADDGKMDVTVTSDARDEVGIMIRSFGKMVQRIHKLIDENYKNKIDLKEFEMKALQAQINPHFLYNTLSMINWKALQAGEKDISKIALRLASFYRTTLNKGRNITIVKDELQNIQDYLEIQLFMHDRSFDVNWEVSNDILMDKMPNLILQPIVENAINHGIDLKEEGKGILIIRGYHDENGLILQVQDNGNGMEEETCQELLTRNTSGYGVKNVYDRIRLLYGDRASLNIKSSLGVGTIITIQIKN
ncbi:sensor histidine kinase [Clostridium sp. Marseille-P299]|uniref:sensor histidine kinase n=1 Tax=Clostridium sp. Marseille-P299 TaxID=1805477 RepID=UPI00082B26E4|nr:histidine kinase [Clostridium sp. Marseille-P299]